MFFPASPAAPGDSDRGTDTTRTALAEGGAAGPGRDHGIGTAEGNQKAPPGDPVRLTK